MSNIVHFIRAGGFVMYPLLLLSLMAIVVIVERLMAYSAVRRVLAPGLLNEVLKQCRAGQYDDGTESVSGAQRASGRLSGSCVAAPQPADAGSGATGGGDRAGLLHPAGAAAARAGYHDDHLAPPGLAGNHRRHDRHIQRDRQRRRNRSNSDAVLAASARRCTRPRPAS